MLATLSVPWMCEMSKHSMRAGASGRFSASCKRFLNGPRGRLQHAEARVEAVLGVGLHQVQQRLLLPALRRADLHLAVALFREQLFQRLAIFEIHRHVNLAGNVLLVEVDLLAAARRRTAARRTPPGLPRRTRGGPRSGRCAGGTGSAPPAAARRSRRRCRRRRPWPRPSSAALRSLPRWSAGRAARRPLRSASPRTPPPCARAGRAPGRCGGLPETAARRAPRAA